MELQRSLFEAEERYIALKQNQERILVSFKRFFPIAVAMLLLGSISPFLFLHSEDPEVNRLVGFATGILVIVALLTLVLTLALWKKFSDKQLTLAEAQLVAAQRSFIQKTMRNVSRRNLLELGFPRGAWERTTVKLGSTEAEDHFGTSKLFELYYSEANGYELKVQELTSNTSN